jgi:cell division septation protein DedD
VHCTKDSIEIKGSIEIILLILIVFLSVVSIGYFYVQKEPQSVNQAMSLINPLLTSIVNQPIAPLKTVQLPTQRQETKKTLQRKTNLAAEPIVVLAAQKTNKKLLPAKQKTAEPLQKNPHKVAETEKTINRSVYSIKVGSFKSRENADRIFKYLKKNNYEPSLETVTLNDNSIWYRVTAGQFETQEEAARSAKNMEEKEKIDTMIVKKKLNPLYINGTVDIVKLKPSERT